MGSTGGFGAGPPALTTVDAPLLQVRIGRPVGAASSRESVMIRKPDLPAKVCAACGRPFTWRRKWRRAWAEVRYCSERCRRVGKPPPKKTNE
jgi:hypothetical protein